jgi:hypothetical protein
MSLLGVTVEQFIHLCTCPVLPDQLWAKGGVGLIIIPFAPVPGGSPVEPGLFDDRFIPGTQRLTTAIHSQGAKVAAQLIVSYHVVFSNGIPEVVGPSPIMNQMMRVIPRELTVDEIHYLVKEFGQSARRASMPWRFSWGVEIFSTAFSPLSAIIAKPNMAVAWKKECGSFWK